MNFLFFSLSCLCQSLPPFFLKHRSVPSYFLIPSYFLLHHQFPSTPTHTPNPTLTHQFHANANANANASLPRRSLSSCGFYFSFSFFFFFWLWFDGWVGQWVALDGQISSGWVRMGRSASTTQHHPSHTLRSDRLVFFFFWWMWVEFHGF